MIAELTENTFAIVMIIDKDFQAMMVNDLELPNIKIFSVLTDRKLNLRVVNS